MTEIVIDKKVFINLVGPIFHIDIQRYPLANFGCVYITKISFCVHIAAKRKFFSIIAIKITPHGSLLIEY